MDTTDQLKEWADENTPVWGVFKGRGDCGPNECPEDRATCNRKRAYKFVGSPEKRLRDVLGNLDDVYNYDPGRK